MRKKLFAILMSAMMMVTFMPAMAFAATSDVVLTWNNEANQVVATYNGTSYTFNTVKNVDAGFTTNGLIKVTPKVSEITGDTTLPSDVRDKMLDAGTAAYYYDVDGAVFLYNTAPNNDAVAAMPSKFYKDGFETVFSTERWDATKTKYKLTGIKLVAPKYAENYDTTSSQTCVMHVGKTLKDWNYTVALPKEYDKNSFAEQTFVVPMTFTRNTDAEVDFSTTHPDLVGATSMTMTVAATTPTIADAEFYVDSESTTNALSKSSKKFTKTDVAYDGAEHTIVLGAADGLAATYTQYNYKTGKWVSVDAPKFKDVAEKDYLFKATVTDSLKGKDVYTIVVNADSAIEPTVEFDAYAEAKSAFEVAGEYNVADFLKVNTGSTAANKAAVEANKALLTEYFNDFYTIKKTTYKFNPEKTTETITLNTTKLDKLTTADKKALVEKYGVLLGNFGIECDVNKVAAYTTTGLTYGFVPGTKAAAHFVVVATKHNEIEFVNAPSKKTFKAKKLKKAAKSFTVKAEALSGVAPSYKLINADSKIKIDKVSGKITLKKGLKKGTYKIKVKAYGCAGNGYVATSETQSITVKVTK